MKILTVESLRQASEFRPQGYLDDLFTHGQVVNGDDGSPAYVVFTDLAFDSLVEKYGRQQQGSSPPVKHGPGTELKKLLAGWPFRIVATANCSCNARAAEMDRRGIEWCEANTDTIVGWLREEAAKRQLPFVDMAGRLLVKRAIRNARKAAS